VSFEEAETALRDPLAFVSPDEGHSAGEERRRVIGTSGLGRVLLVIIAAGRGGTLRIVSARRATKRKRHAYEDGW